MLTSKRKPTRWWVALPLLMIIISGHSPTSADAQPDAHIARNLPVQPLADTRGAVAPARPRTPTRTPMKTPTATPTSTPTPSCGLAWQIVPTSNATALYGVAAVTATDVWAVGQDYTAGSLTLTMHWNGSAWSVVPSPNIGEA